MKLIDDWRQAWRFLSVQASAICSAVLLAWVALPMDQQAAILGLIGLNGPALIALVGFVAVVIARLKAQPELDPVDSTAATRNIRD